MKTQMRFYGVVFPNSERLYTFKSTLKLRDGTSYTAIAADGTRYEEIKVISRLTKVLFPKDRIKEVTGVIQKIVPRQESPIKSVHHDEKKNTTVVLWVDGTMTKVIRDERDTPDLEKAIAIAYMKRMNCNSSNFNECLKPFLTKET